MSASPDIWPQLPPSRLPAAAVAVPLARPAAGDGLIETDGELLRLFTRHGETAAFDKLVERHSAMVWRVCRQSLRRRQDAEDAFQATFLLLVKSARQIGASESAAGWLFRVAYRTSLRARKRLASRREEALALDPTAPSEIPFPDLTARQHMGVLAEELMELPLRYQTPLVMRYIEGQSRRAIAEATDVTVATVQGRLARGKQLLRRRLVRRGVSLSVAVGVLTSNPRAEAAAASTHLLLQTTTSAVSLATGGTLAASTAVVLLLEQGTRAMLFASLTKPMAAAAACGLATLVLAAPPVETTATASDGVVLTAALVDDAEGEETEAPTATLQLAANEPASEGEPEALAPGVAAGNNSAVVRQKVYLVEVLERALSQKNPDKDVKANLDSLAATLANAVGVDRDAIRTFAKNKSIVVGADQPTHERLRAYLKKVRSEENVAKFVAEVLSEDTLEPTDGKPEASAPPVVDPSWRVLEQITEIEDLVERSSLLRKKTMDLFESNRAQVINSIRQDDQQKPTWKELLSHSEPIRLEQMLYENAALDFEAAVGQASKIEKEIEDLVAKPEQFKGNPIALDMLGDLAIRAKRLPNKVDFVEDDAKRDFESRWEHLYKVPAYMAVAKELTGTASFSTVQHSQLQVAEFQRKHGLKETGEFDEATWNQLFFVAKKSDEPQHDGEPEASATGVAAGNDSADEERTSLKEIERKLQSGEEELRRLIKLAARSQAILYSENPKYDEDVESGNINAGGVELAGADGYGPLSPKLGSMTEAAVALGKQQETQVQKTLWAAEKALQQYVREQVESAENQEGYAELTKRVPTDVKDHLKRLEALNRYKHLAEASLTQPYYAKKKAQFDPATFDLDAAIKRAVDDEPQHDGEQEASATGVVAATNPPQVTATLQATSESPAVTATLQQGDPSLDLRFGDMALNGRKLSDTEQDELLRKQWAEAAKKDPPPVDGEPSFKELHTWHTYWEHQYDALRQQAEEMRLHREGAEASVTEGDIQLIAADIFKSRAEALRYERELKLRALKDGEPEASATGVAAAKGATTARSQSEPTRERTPAPPLGSGDKLELSTWGAGPKSANSGAGVIGPDGAFEFGSLKIKGVAGKTLDEAQAIIADHVRKQLNDSTVQVRIGHPEFGFAWGARGGTAGSSSSGARVPASALLDEPAVPPATKTKLSAKGDRLIIESQQPGETLRLTGRELTLNGEPQASAIGGEVAVSGRGASRRGSARAAESTDELAHNLDQTLQRFIDAVNDANRLLVVSKSVDASMAEVLHQAAAKSFGEAQAHRTNASEMLTKYAGIAALKDKESLAKATTFSRRYAETQELLEEVTNVYNRRNEVQPSTAELSEESKSKTPPTGASLKTAPLPPGVKVRVAAPQRVAAFEAVRVPAPAEPLAEVSPQYADFQWAGDAQVAQQAAALTVLMKEKLAALEQASDAFRSRTDAAKAAAPQELAQLDAMKGQLEQQLQSLQVAGKVRQAAPMDPASPVAAAPPVRVEFQAMPDAPMPDMPMAEQAAASAVLMKEQLAAFERATKELRSGAHRDKPATQQVLAQLEAMKGQMQQQLNVLQAEGMGRKAQAIQFEAIEKPRQPQEKDVFRGVPAPTPTKIEFRTSELAPAVQELETLRQQNEMLRAELNVMRQQIEKSSFAFADARAQWQGRTNWTSPQSFAVLLPLDKSGRPGKYAGANQQYGFSVQQLQQRLNEVLKPSPNLDIDGDYGPQTVAAVKRLQTDRGLRPSGVADEPTRRAMGLLEVAPAPQATTLESKMWQRVPVSPPVPAVPSIPAVPAVPSAPALKTVPAPNAPSGPTPAPTKPLGGRGGGYQTFESTPPPTGASLTGSPPPPSETTGIALRAPKPDGARIKYAKRNSEYGWSVLQLQERLNQVLKQSTPLRVDGDYGPLTEAAVKEFQRVRELPVTGDVDARTREALGFVEPEGTLKPASEERAKASSAAPQLKLGKWRHFDDPSLLYPRSWAVVAEVKDGESAPIALPNTEKPWPHFRYVRNGEPGLVWLIDPGHKLDGVGVSAGNTTLSGGFEVRGRRIDARILGPGDRPDSFILLIRDVTGLLSDEEGRMLPLLTTAKQMLKEGKSSDIASAE